MLQRLIEIPASVLDDAVLSLSRQIARLYDYHLLRSRYTAGPIRWDETGPSGRDLRDPRRAMDFAHQSLEWIEKSEVKGSCKTAAYWFIFEAKRIVRL